MRDSRRQGGIWRAVVAALFWGCATGMLLPYEYLAVSGLVEPPDFVIRIAGAGFVGGAVAAGVLATGRLQCNQSARRWAFDWCLIGVAACLAAPVAFVLADSIAPFYPRSERTVFAIVADLASGLFLALAAAGLPALLTGVLISLLTLPVLVLIRRRLCRRPPIR